MFKRLFRWLITAIIVIALLVLFLPRLFANAGNSLLNSTDNTSAQGLAQFVPAGVGKTNELQLKLDGLQASSPYEVTLDQGQCGSFAPMDLGSVTTDGGGSAYSEFSLSQLDTAKSWFVDVHQGAYALGATVACGQLELNQSVTTQLALNAQGGSTDSASVNLSVGSGNSSGLPQTTGSGSSGQNPTGLPNTGAAPGNQNSYDNNTFPRKY